MRSLCVFFILIGVHAFRLPRLVHPISKSCSKTIRFASKNDGFNDPSSFESLGSLFNQEIEWVRSELFAPSNEDTMSNIPFKLDMYTDETLGPPPTVATNSDPSLIEIAILPAFGSGPLFPSSREFLFIFEMRFRSLFSDAEKNQGLLGRSFVSDNDDIASIGTLCRIIESKKVSDGKGFYIIESMSRFKIKQILQRTPYIRAQVELLEDEESTWNHAWEAQQASRNIYSLLKQYLRLNAASGHDGSDDEYEEEEEEGEEVGIGYGVGTDQDETPEEGNFSYLVRNEEPESDEAMTDEYYEDDEDYDGDDTPVISFTAPIRESRPLSMSQALTHSAKSLLSRCTLFSHAVANLLQRETIILQQLLQCSSLLTRLAGLQAILADAVEQLAEALIEEQQMSADEVNEIREMSFDPRDDESQMLPPLSYSGITLETELDDNLLVRMGMKPSMIVSTSKYIGEGRFITTNTQSELDQDKDNISDSDPFDDPNAFQ